ncbi:MAG: Copper-exporting P-type ATPase A [Firmicutes bacterium ADurb.Bin182]|nr:MAG: Copper-exporting P-type ATPase A [Firmicutes bacterium ADurb.Bin182]
MAIAERKLNIDGMTCVSCESGIERKLKNTEGIEKVSVSYAKGMAVISYYEDKISLTDIIRIIERLDYQAAEAQNREFNKNSAAVKLAGIAVILFAAYIFANNFGLPNFFSAFPTAKEGMGYGMLLIIGALTSIHCVAMCGGINLSQCVPAASSFGSGKFASLKPSLLYNLGRVISYTAVGAIVGAVGSVISFSGTAKGIVQLAAGIFMVIMGLNMLNLFPALRKLSIRMPKGFADKVHEKKKGKGPLVVGLLNGLMPCGPLQSMQLYALSTGSVVSGAVSMFLFSIGTVPLMFGLGALSSVLSKKFTGKMMTVSAYLVVILGVFMFTNGLSLSGVNVTEPVKKASAQSQYENAAVLKGGVQTVTTKLLNGRYQPITVQKGIPVKWTIQADENDINGCNYSIIIPKLNKQIDLVPGDNVIEFTPEENGTIPYSCWMGMIRNKIIVVDDLENPAPQSGSVENESEYPAGGPGGTVSDYKIPSDTAMVAKIEDGIQVVSIDMDGNGFAPAVVVMQRGLKTKWTINGKKLTESNSSLVFPLYGIKAGMKEGENTIALIPEEDFEFAAGDYSFFGFVKVVDDIKTADLDSIKNEVKNLIPTIPDFDFGAGSGGQSCH